MTYEYQGKSFSLVANGHTGKIAGRYPKSGWKIFFLIMAALLVLLFVLFAS